MGKPLITFVSLLFFVGTPSAVSEAADLPNVVIVSIDTLRADHCSVYGYRRETTPYLDLLSQEGALFEDAYAPMGQTSPSHSTLFTGDYPLKHGVIRNGRVLPEDRTTLAERLSELGYDTAAFVSAFPMERRFGLNQGFATFDDVFPLAQQTIDLRSWEGEVLQHGFDRRGDFTLVKAREWLAGKAGASPPFFLFVHLFDPHTPYKPPRRAVELVLGGEPIVGKLEATKAAYDGEIRFVDGIVGRILQQLKDIDAEENTIFIVTSDHGEGLMQRGYLLHGLTVHEEEVKVPLLVRWPGKIQAGLRVRGPVTVADVVPTLLGLIGEAPASDFDGLDLSGTLTKSERVPLNRPVFFMRPNFEKTTIGSGWSGTLPDGRKPPRIPVHGAHYGVRLDEWKYIVAPEEGTAQLYNLRTDPQETNEISARHEAIAKTMRGHIDRWLEANPAESAADELLDKETLKALEALGYTN
jgi:choline-sulfatase